MTLFAGVVCRHPTDSLPEFVEQKLKSLISCTPNDNIEALSSSRAFIVKVDIGAFKGRAFIRDSDGTASVLAGDPVLSPAIGARSRVADLARLHTDWRTRRTDTLTQARGVFSLVQFDAGTSELRLVADKLAVRPLYYWMDERHVLFASSLRVLLGSGFVPRRIDPRGMTELATSVFPSPIARRTSVCVCCGRRRSSR